MWQPFPKFYIIRQDAQFVPLIPLDELPSWLQVGQYNWMDPSLYMFMVPATTSVVPREGEYDVLCQFCLECVDGTLHRSVSQSRREKRRKLNHHSDKKASRVVDNVPHSRGHQRGLRPSNPVDIASLLPSTTDRHRDLPSKNPSLKTVGSPSYSPLSSFKQPPFYASLQNPIVGFCFLHHCKRYFRTQTASESNLPAEPENSQDVTREAGTRPDDQEVPAGATDDRLVPLLQDPRNQQRLLRAPALRDPQASQGPSKLLGPSSSSGPFIVGDPSPCKVPGPSDDEPATDDRRNGNGTENREDAPNPSSGGGIDAAAIFPRLARTLGEMLGEMPQFYGVDPDHLEEVLVCLLRGVLAQGTRLALQSIGNAHASPGQASRLQQSPQNSPTRQNLQNSRASKHSRDSPNQERSQGSQCSADHHDQSSQVCPSKQDGQVPEHKSTHQRSKDVRVSPRKENPQELQDTSGRSEREDPVPQKQSQSPRHPGLLPCVRTRSDTGLPGSSVVDPHTQGQLDELELSAVPSFLKSPQKEMEMDEMFFDERLRPQHPASLCPPGPPQLPAGLPLPTVCGTHGPVSGSAEIAIPEGNSTIGGSPADREPCDPPEPLSAEGQLSTEKQQRRPPQREVGSSSKTPIPGHLPEPGITTVNDKTPDGRLRDSRLILQETLARQGRLFGNFSTIPSVIRQENETANLTGPGFEGWLDTLIDVVKDTTPDGQWSDSRSAIQEALAIQGRLPVSPSEIPSVMPQDRENTGTSDESREEQGSTLCSELPQGTENPRTSDGSREDEAPIKCLERPQDAEKPQILDGNGERSTECSEFSQEIQSLHASDESQEKGNQAIDFDYQGDEDVQEPRERPERGRQAVRLNLEDASDETQGRGRQAVSFYPPVVSNENTQPPVVGVPGGKKKSDKGKAPMR